MATDLAKFAEDNGVKYFMISFTDLFGGLTNEILF